MKGTTQHKIIASQSALSIINIEYFIVDPSWTDMDRQNENILSSIIIIIIYIYISKLELYSTLSVGASGINIIIWYILDHGSKLTIIIYSYRYMTIISLLNVIIHKFCWPISSLLAIYYICVCEISLFSFAM